MVGSRLGGTPSRRIGADQRVPRGHRDGERCGIDACRKPTAVPRADHTPHCQQSLHRTAMSVASPIAATLAISAAPFAISAATRTLAIAATTARVMHR